MLFGGDPWLVYCGVTANISCFFSPTPWSWSLVSRASVLLGINDETVNHRLPQILEAKAFSCFRFFLCDWIWVIVQHSGQESARSLWRSLGCLSWNRNLNFPTICAVFLFYTTSRVLLHVDSDKGFGGSCENQVGRDPPVAHWINLYRTTRQTRPQG